MLQGRNTSQIAVPIFGGCLHSSLPPGIKNKLQKIKYRRHSFAKNKHVYIYISPCGSDGKAVRHDTLAQEIIQAPQ